MHGEIAVVTKDGLAVAQRVSSVCLGWITVLPRVSVSTVNRCYYRYNRSSRVRF